MNWKYTVPVLLVSLLLIRYAAQRPASPVAPFPWAQYGPSAPIGPYQAPGLDPSVRGRHGPYVRIDRANEVAAHFRSLGYNAEVVYLGTVDFREYAVDVR